MQHGWRPTTKRWRTIAIALALVAHASIAPAADPAKVLRVAFTSAEMSFDPQFSADAATDGVIDHIFESMLDYDYLARPVKLVPRTLVAMPIVEDHGATYVFRFRPGIFFTPDPAFNGRPRELTAADQAYALKRLLDPAVRSPWLWLGRSCRRSAASRSRSSRKGRRCGSPSSIASSTSSRGCRRSSSSARS